MEPSDHDPDRSRTPTAIVDERLCIGSGTCVRIAAGAFVLDEDGVAAPADTSLVPYERLLLAARSCPTAAITITEPDD
jgi:ferredoxin